MHWMTGAQPYGVQYAFSVNVHSDKPKLHYI